MDVKKILEFKLGNRFIYKELINPLGNSVLTSEQLEPSYKVILNAKKIAAVLDDFLAMHPGLFIRVTAWFRSPKENQRVGGSPTSSHKEALAIDFEVVEESTGREVNEDFVSWVKNRQVPFDQIILFNSEAKPTAIHFGLGPKMRHQWMIWTQAGGYQNL